MESCTLNFGISTGKANAMFIASFNIGLSCYMHDITACALYIYISEREAYEIYMKQSKDEDNISE